MKVLNRPMFRYGGPIKEGIMSGIKEPRQRYRDAGQVFKNVQASLQPGQVADPKVLNAAAQLGIGNPYKEFDFKPYMKRTVTKPTDPMMLEDYKGDFSGLSSDFDQVQKVTLDDGSTVMVNVPAQDVKPSATTQSMWDGDYEKFKKNKALEDAALEKEKDRIQKIKSGPVDTSSVTGVPDFVTGKGGVDEIIKKKGKIDDDPPVEKTRKEKVNSILESLGYDRAQKNALYDAMIKAGQRISRTGLGADNLVSDIIAETSQSYDKPEKLREAANLMQAQQDLKLEQIEASKTGGKLKQDYDFYKSQGDSDELAEKKARNLPTTITEKFNASKASTDSGKVYNVTMELTEEGFFGEKYKNKYNGRVGKKYETVTEFVQSDDFKGDGVYNFKGEAFLIEDGKVTKRQIIQPKVDKEGFFS